MMESRDFVFWLQGFFELSGATELTDKQVLIIQDHLALVFKKETPDRSEETPPLTFSGGDIGLSVNTAEVAGSYGDPSPIPPECMSDLPANTPQPQYGEITLSFTDGMSHEITKDLAHDLTYPMGT